ncbi:MAG: hypothetical protein NUV60_01205 [Patescibacteria group bacterium]|nr:hypothetical protein [Patescibacteria group bacterium]
MADDDQPKKYIRTFAGDIETLQKGGVPDLAPLVEPTAREKLVAASPITEQPEAPPASLIQTTPPPTYVPPSSANAPIETYSGDFSDRMKRTQASTATVIAAEQDAGPRPISPRETLPQQWSRSSIVYTSVGVILLLAGVVGGAISYMRYLNATAPVDVAPMVTAPIFVDEREQISGTGVALTQAVVQSVARMIEQGSVRLLYLGNATDSMGSSQATTSIFSVLPLSAPSGLLRNINNAQSMAGVVNVSGTQSPFFIVSVTAYSETFASMLSWERSMPYDLEKLFPVSPATVSTSATTASSTVSTSSPQVVAPTVPAVTPAFHDEIVSNHDVRVYRDATGKSLFLYGYWNQLTLIIARDSAAFAEIAQRLATSHTQPQ